MPYVNVKITKGVSVDQKRKIRPEPAPKIEGSHCLYATHA